MKRSEINRALEWAEKLLNRHAIRLPGRASWDLDKWAENKEHLDLVRERMLGWDVAELGGELPCVLYTLRNSDPCRERCILMREGQQTPIRVQHSPAELINRAGGVLAVRLWNVGADGELLASDVTALSDGMERTVSADGELRVYPGDSLSLAPGLAHSFGPAPGYGDLILTELARPGIDAGAPMEIDEDARVLYPLCHEYAKLI